MLRVPNLSLTLHYREEELPAAAARRLKTGKENILSCRLYKRSVDARDKGDVHFVATVDVTVRRLREKIEENPASPKYILTRRGVGYYFAV